MQIYIGLYIDLSIDSRPSDSGTEDHNGVLRVHAVLYIYLYLSIYLSICIYEDV